MKRKMILVLFFAIVAILLCSCGESINKQVLGHWKLNIDESEGGGFYNLYIFEDGTLYYEEPTSIATCDVANWTIVNENELKFTWKDSLNSYRSGTDIYKIDSISSDRMICNVNGREEKTVYDKVD